MVSRRSLVLLVLLAATAPATSARGAEVGFLPVQRRPRLVGDLRAEGIGYGTQSAGAGYSSLLLQEGGIARLYGFAVAPGLVSGWVEAGLFRVNQLGSFEGGGWRYQLGTHLTLLGLSRYPLTLYLRTHRGTGVLAAIPGGGVVNDQVGARWVIRFPGLPRLLLKAEQVRYALIAPTVSEGITGVDQGQGYEGLTRTASAILRHGEKGLHIDGRFEVQQRLDLDQGQVQREQVRQTVHLRGDADLGATTHWLIEGRADNYLHAFQGQTYDFGRFYARSYLRWRPDLADQGSASYDFTGDGFTDYQSHVLNVRHDHALTERLSLIGGLRAQHFGRHFPGAEATYGAVVGRGGVRWQDGWGRWLLRVEDHLEAGAARSDPGDDGLILANWLRGDASYPLSTHQRLSLQGETRVHHDGSELGSSGASLMAAGRYTALLAGFHLGAGATWHYGRDFLDSGLGFEQTRQAVTAEATAGRALGRWGSLATTVGHRLTLYDHGVGDFAQTYLTGTATLLPHRNFSLRGRAAFTRTRFAGLDQDSLIFGVDSQWVWRKLEIGGVFQYTLDDAAGLERRYWTALVRASRRFVLGG